LKIHPKQKRIPKTWTTYLSRKTQQKPTTMRTTTEKPTENGNQNRKFTEKATKMPQIKATIVKQHK